jgi:hypothetical protein
LKSVKPTIRRGALPAKSGRSQVAASGQARHFVTGNGGINLTLNAIKIH